MVQQPVRPLSVHCTSRASLVLSCCVLGSNGPGKRRGARGSAALRGEGRALASRTREGVEGEGEKLRARERPQNNRKCTYAGEYVCISYHRVSAYHTGPLYDPLQHGHQWHCAGSGLWVYSVSLCTVDCGTVQTAAPFSVLRSHTRDRPRETKSRKWHACGCVHAPIYHPPSAPPRS